MSNKMAIEDLLTLKIKCQINYNIRSFFSQDLLKTNNIESFHSP